MDPTVGATVDLRIILGLGFLQTSIPREILIYGSVLHRTDDLGLNIPENDRLKKSFALSNPVKFHAASEACEKTPVICKFMEAAARGRFLDWNISETLCSFTNMVIDRALSGPHEVLGLISMRRSEFGR